MAPLTDWTCATCSRNLQAKPRPVRFGVSHDKQHVRNEMKIRTRTIWTMAGLAWGLLVGLAASLQTAAFLFGVGWLFVFGDSPWPAAVGPVVLSMTIVAGLVPAFLIAWIGRRLGIAFESEGRQRLRARRRGWTVFAVAVAAAAVGVAAAVVG